MNFAVFLLITVLSGALWIVPPVSASDCPRDVKEITGTFPRSPSFIWERKSGDKILRRFSEVDGGVRIFWWNIAAGTIKETLRRKGYTFDIPPLDQNLIELARSQGSPDVIVLAEYSDSALMESTKEQLAEKYPYQTLVPYNKDFPTLGIYVMSKAPPQSSPFLTPLGWVPPDLTPEQEQKYRKTWSTLQGQGEGKPYPKAVLFERTYSEFEFEIRGLKFHLVPVHTMHAWDKSLKENPGWRGQLKSFFDLCCGGKNPIMQQVREVQSLLHSRFQNWEDSNLVVVGDFNLPPYLSRGYRTVSQGLTDLLPNPLAATFPTSLSDDRGHYPPLQIDHGFASPGLRSLGAAVLPMTGSDHYPIYFIVKSRVSEELF